MNKEQDTVLRIIEFHAENIKRLKAIRLKPDGTLVRIEGRNAAGKSSVLDAICAALGGAKWTPDCPIRKGEKRAAVTLDIGEYTIERTWTVTGGGGLKLSTKDGNQVPSPQTVLGKLADELLFDPVAFERMKPSDQAEILRRITGLDFTELEAKRNRLYADRTIANRDAKAAQARANSVPDAPANRTRIDVRVLATKQQETLAHNRKCDEAEAAYKRAKDNVETAKRTVIEAQNRLEEATKVADAAYGRASNLLRKDEGDLVTDIANAEAHNNSVRRYEEWETLAKYAKELASTAAAFDTEIAKIDDAKERLLAAAKFPLDGLGFSEIGITMNGVPFSQASSSERLRAAVAIGLSAKKRLRVLLIRDGSLLDQAALADLHRIVESFDAQVFVERVSEGPEPGAVYIEDGELVDPEMT